MSTVKKILLGFILLGLGFCSITQGNFVGNYISLDKQYKVTITSDKIFIAAGTEVMSYQYMANVEKIKEAIKFFEIAASQNHSLSLNVEVYVGDLTLIRGIAYDRVMLSKSLTEKPLWVELVLISADGNKSLNLVLDKN